MSKLILCHGVRAKKPYYFKLTNTNIFSIEELCYYIYNNIYSIDEEEFNDCLIKWIKEEIEMVELSEQLEKLVYSKAKIKELVTIILNKANYYTNQEIVLLLQIVDKIEKHPKIVRRKIKADNYLKYKQYSNAMDEYENILKDPELSNCDNSFIGNIKHSIGVLYARMMDFENAEESFLSAYNMNNNIESLKQYLYVLILAKKEQKFNEFLNQNKELKETAKEVVYVITDTLEDACVEDDYLYIEKALNSKNQGQVSEYYRRIDKIINTWKKDYRHQTLR